MTFCVSRAPFVLSGATPAGGVYSGKGVSGNVFDPAAAGVGSHLITYKYTDANNQVLTCGFTINLYEYIQPICPLAGEYAQFCIGSAPSKPWICINDPDITINFSGPGIFDNKFHPAIAGLGLHVFDIDVKDADGCGLAYTTIGLEVIEGAPPTITCPDNITVSSSTSPAFKIPGTSSPTYDYWYSGKGVIGSSFNPAVAGNGTHTITYDLGGFGDMVPVCFSTCSFEISVGSLPVTLSAFKVLNQEDRVALQWESFTEQQFDRFEIEKSLNPKQGFTKISEIKGEGSRSSYSFVDQQAEKGIPLYYRLKMIDTDGSYAYSSMVWTLIEGTEKLTVYPNPVSRQVNIESPLKMSEIQVMDMSGVAVFTEALNSVNKKAVALPALPSGVYLLQVKSTNSSFIFSRLVIR